MTTTERAVLWVRNANFGDTWHVAGDAAERALCGVAPVFGRWSRTMGYAPPDDNPHGFRRHEVTCRRCRRLAGEEVAPKPKRPPTPADAPKGLLTRYSHALWSTSLVVHAFHGERTLCGLTMRGERGTARADWPHPSDVDCSTCAEALRRRRADDASGGAR